MLPAKNRLNLRTEFRKIKERGDIIQGEFLNFLFIKPDSKVSVTAPRFGFVVPKRIEKRIVRRNYTKRVIQGAVRSLLPYVSLGTEGIFLVKRVLKGENFFKIKEAIREIFIKAGVFNEKGNFSNN